MQPVGNDAPLPNRMSTLHAHTFSSAQKRVTHNLKAQGPQSHHQVSTISKRLSDLHSFQVKIKMEHSMLKKERQHRCFYVFCMTFWDVNDCQAIQKCKFRSVWDVNDYHGHVLYFEM